MNKFTEVMRKRTDEELLAIVNENRHDYQQEAIEAAYEVLNERSVAVEIKSDAQIALEEEVERSYIHYIDKSMSQIDLEFHKQVGILFSSCKWAGIITLVLDLICLLNGVVEDCLIYLLHGAAFFALSRWAMNLITYRKQNAIFISKAMIYMCMGSWILTALLGSTIGILGLLTLINGYKLIKSLKTEEVLTVFPVEYRQHSSKDWFIVLDVLIAPYFFGLIYALNVQ